MKTQTAIRYYVTYEGMGGHFSEDGWSGYNERWRLKNDGLLDGEDVYGYKQAQEHIEQLKTREYLGKLAYPNVQWQIQIITTVVTVIPIN
jgi:hypothetical protein